MSEIDPSLKAGISVDAFRRGLVSLGNFTLAGGQWSPYYLDLRPLPSLTTDPEVTSMSIGDQQRFLDNVVDVYNRLVDLFRPDHIQSIPEATDHLVGMIGFSGGHSVLKRRVKQKDHGTGDNILGHYQSGDTTVLVDDVISSAGSKLKEKDLVESLSAKRQGEPGLLVSGAVALLDREMGGVQAAEQAGMIVVGGLTLTEFVSTAHAQGVLSDNGYEIIEGYRQGDITKPEDISLAWASINRPTPAQMFA